MGQIKNAVILSFFNIGLTNIIGLILTPFIVFKLGSSEYGLYSLIGSLIAYLNLMDFGLNNSVVRFVSKYQAEKKTLEEQKFLGTTLFVYLLISVLLLVLGFCIYLNLKFIFKNSLTSDQLNDARVMFLILMFNIAVTLPGGTFGAICTAYRSFVFPKALQIVKYILRSITVLCVLQIGGRAIALVVIDTIFNIIFIFISLYYCVNKLKIKFDFRGSHKERVREIFSYSIWIFIIVIVQTFQWNAGQIIIGINNNTEMVAVFSIGIMLGSYLGAFAGVFNTLLLPKAATDVSANTSGFELTKSMIRIGRVNVFVSFVIITGFALLGKDFINLWLGVEFIDAWRVALIIMLVTIIPLSQSFGLSILEVKNKIKYRSIAVFINMTSAIFFSYYFSQYYGIFGVIVPIAIAMLLNTLVNNILFIIHFQFKLIKFYKETFVYQVLFTTLFILSAHLLKRTLQITDWFDFLFQGTFYTLIYILLYYLLLFREDEKSLIFNYKLSRKESV
jgi:O-antigen/teichoic acid export membrane protein